MVSTRVKLTEHQIHQLEELASQSGCSPEELIRRSVDELLKKGKLKPSRESRKERALAIIGRYNSGLGDLAQEHDKYLAEDL